MKKALQSIITLILVNVCMPAYSQTGIRPRGDVDCDWRVSVNDITAEIDSILCQTKYNSFYNYAFDINGDKKISITDVTLIIDALMGQELPPMPSYSGTLPVLYIITEDHRNIDSKEEYIHANWWFDAMAIEGYESIGSPNEPLGMQIKGRGNYTWLSFNKKSFRLKLDTKQPIMGMNSNRHFCLLAHPDDHYAKLKNTVGFELSRRIGLAYTPAQEPVEVVLNGQYIGLYFLTEKIRIEKNRVNIEEQEDEETNPALITGGWLLEIDNYSHEGLIYFRERNNGQNWYDWIWFTSHSPEVLSTQQRQYIKQFLQTVNAAIYNPCKIINEWEQYINIDSLVCFYIIAEMMDNIEAFSGSCYLYKHRGDSTKLIFGPVWDFGQAFGRLERTDATNFEYFVYQECSFYTHWIEEIAKYPHFQLVVRKHWREFYDSGFNGLDLDQFINDHVTQIRQAWYCDAKRWSGVNIDREANRYKNYMYSKIAWLNSKWGIGAHIDPDPHEYNE